MTFQKKKQNKTLQFPKTVFSKSFVLFFMSGMKQM